ncbi:MAG: Spy/CpxP family protein refolding chaperone [Xanthobacteraceae bacterium]
MKKRTSGEPAMKKRTIGILATSVAISALCVMTDVPAFAGKGGGGGRGGGGGGGGHGFGGGGGHGFGGGGGFHGFAAHGLGGGGGFHGFAAHGGEAHVGHGLSVHGLSAHAGHGFTSHAMSRGSHHFAGHNLSHSHALMGHAGRIAGHGITSTGHNALATHNQLNGARSQFAHNQLSHNQLSHNQLSHNQFAHHQFVAQNFHGLNNFNHTGFNRNAFGNNANWNHWGGRFWGAGWNNWGWGWGGWAGPVFWPFLLGDALSFILWPYAYYDPFWWYGSPFIWASIFAPGPYFGLDYGYGPDYYGYGYGTGYYGYAGSPNIYYDSSRGGGYNTAARGRYAARTEQAPDREALAETNTEALQSCTGLAPGVTNLPIDQIRQTVHPTADQQAALDDLNAASSQASDVIKSSCPSSVPLTPIGRLDAAEQRLDATIKAIQIIRSPLERFYQALSDEQRQRFNAMSGSTEGAPSAGNMVAACSQQAGSFIDLPVQRIEQVVQPTAQQQSGLNDLKKAAQKAGDQLQSSCPTAVPKSPVARVDTIETRLTAMADGIKSVRPDLQNFYASLSDEQKAKFNTMGPPPKATSSPQQRQSGGQQ